MKLEPLIALTILVIISPFLILIMLIIKLESKGPALFWSKRYGLNKNIFYMPKFRSMIINTPISSTQTLKTPELYVTKFGNVIRKTSVDELPQLWSIILGDMSFIGP